MPKNFTDCVANGGKIRTKTLSKTKYMHICILNGKTYAGEVKTKKKSKKKSKSKKGYTPQVKKAMKGINK